MDRVTVKNCLRAMWPILYSASKRRLEERELLELARLLRIVESGVVTIPGFKDQCDAFCLAVRSCGLFEKDREPSGLEGLRGKVDELSALID